MNILYDPCCLGAIAILVVVGIGKFISLIVAECRRGRNESTLDQYREKETAQPKA